MVREDQKRTKDFHFPGGDHDITGTKVVTAVRGTTGLISEHNISASRAGTHKRRAQEDQEPSLVIDKRRRDVEVDKELIVFGSQGLSYSQLMLYIRSMSADRIKVAKEQEDGTSKVGSHSIQSEYNLTELVADLKPEDQPPGRYLIDYMLDGVHNTMDDMGYIPIDNGAGGYWAVSTNIVQSALNGGVETAIRRESKMACRASFPADQAVLVRIQWGGGRITSRITDESVEPFRIGGCTNVKALVGLLATEIRSMNNSTVGLLGKTMDIGLDRADNTSLYAKAWFTYNLLHMAKVANYSPGVPDGIPSSSITVIDLNLGLPAVDLLCTRIEAGDFILVSHKDWNARDLQIIVWLALAGTRPAADPVNVKVFPAHYVDLPEIKFCLVWDDPLVAPALPTPGPIVADELMNFIVRLAKNRCEELDFVNGWHLAVGMTYLQVEELGNASQRKFAVGSYLDVLGEDWPRPRDYSFVCRVLKLITSDPKSRECRLLDRLVQFTSIQLISLGAVCWQILSSMTATLFYDFSIRGAQLHVLRAEGLVDSHLNVIWNILSRPNQSDESRICGLYQQVSVAIASCTGAFWPYEFRPQCIWGGTVVYTGYGNRGYNSWGEFGTPYSGDIFSIDGWLKHRPLEWGLTSLKPRCTFESEVQVHGTYLRRGWLGVYGDVLYSARPAGQRPYMVVPYGAMAINVLLQTERPNVLWTINAWKAKWFIQRTPTWTERELIPQPIFDPELHVIKPLSLYSWDWITHEVCAPEINCPDVSEGTIFKWVSFSNTDLRGAGFQSGSKPIRFLPGDKIAMELPSFGKLTLAAVEVEKTIKTLKGDEERKSGLGEEQKG